ncbi:MAG TPA: L,D-transpeptidase, partial [Longimicrobiaceae bacterium]|nr:L,D-transpeptidase [Longimicrobiaceae bacterium]
MNPRTTRTGGPERRNYTPPGRLRRISFEHRGPTLALLALVALVAGLFVATTAWAVNERFERDVARIAYSHDTESLRFLQERAARSVAEMEERARTLEAREAEMAPSDRPYLVVSIAERKVVYLKGNDTLFSAPVAVGSGKTLVMGGKTMRFQTPRGKMAITHKELDPVWVPPNWHYIEIARNRGLRVVDMSNAHPNALAGFPPGREPIRGGTIYIPPWGSPQRKHKGVLGVAKLEMYDGYYFHGTDNEASIGTAASHGCIRMRR